MGAKSFLLRDLVDELERDQWREQQGFSTDIENCHRILFASGTNRDEKAKVLDAWLAHNQPCLFGRMEARQENRLHYCILTENDLERSDQDIKKRISDSRTYWKREAYHGNSHGFLIVMISEKIAHAAPDPKLLALAKQLCNLYLDQSEEDKIFHDDLILELNQPTKSNRSWKVGVNYFSAQGDKRWWHDHRFPGGIVGRVCLNSALQIVQFFG